MNTTYFLEFKNNLEKMQSIEANTEHQSQLNYAYIITCMECYLYKAMWGTLDREKTLYVKLGSAIKQSVKLNTICDMGLDVYIKEHLKNFQYHNLAIVKIYYKTSFDINFPQDMSELFKAVNIRHNIIHRCGYNKYNESNNISFIDVEKLKNDISIFIKNIDIRLFDNFYKD